MTAALQASGIGLPAVVGGLLLAGVGVAVYAAIEVVDAHEKRMLSVDGEYRRLLEPGVHVVPPFVSTTESIDRRSQRANASVETTTADGVTATVEAAVDVAVTDAERAFQETDDYRRDLLAVAEASLRRAVSDVRHGALEDDPGDVADRVRLTVERRTTGWGIEVEGAALTAVDLESPSDGA